MSSRSICRKRGEFTSSRDIVFELLRPVGQFLNFVNYLLCARSYAQFSAYSCTKARAKTRQDNFR